MDIASKTLVLIILVLGPGFIFRRFYFQGTFARQFDSKSWSHSLFYSALFGLILNLIAFNSYEYYFKTISYESCLNFYNSISKESIDQKVSKTFNFIDVSNYLMLLYGASIALAWISYLLVRNFKLDRYYTPLRFSNHWHYYFKGEVKDFREFSLPKGISSATAADILVKSEKNGSNLYTGLLVDHSLDNDGNLESIILSEPKIYKTELKVFSEIESHILIIPYSTVQNINLRFTFKEEDNTTIDFLAIIMFIFTTVYVFLDPSNIFSAYTLLSKIGLKLLAFLCALGISSTFFSYVKYFISNSKTKNIILNETNLIQQSKINEMKKLALENLVSTIFFISLLLIILWLT